MVAGLVGVLVMEGGARAMWVCFVLLRKFADFRTDSLRHRHRLRESAKHVLETYMHK